jgi:hypothetical protein
MRRIVLTALMAVAGCASPGSTISLVSASPAAVTLEYTHSYSFELGETIRAAEQQCGYHRRHAVLISNTRLDIDRSIATFRCVD